jgi:hypothetical protein
MLHALHSILSPPTPYSTLYSLLPTLYSPFSAAYFARARFGGGAFGSGA